MYYSYSMPRPHIDSSRTNVVQLRLTDSELALLDTRRGPLTRSQFMRSRIFQSTPATSAPLPVEPPAVQVEAKPSGQRHLHRMLDTGAVTWHKGPIIHLTRCECGHEGER